MRHSISSLALLVVLVIGCGESRTDNNPPPASPGVIGSPGTPWRGGISAEELAAGSSLVPRPKSAEPSPVVNSVPAADGSVREAGSTRTDVRRTTVEQIKVTEISVRERENPVARYGPNADPEEEVAEALQPGQKPKGNTDAVEAVAGPGRPNTDPIDEVAGKGKNYDRPDEVAGESPNTDPPDNVASEGDGFDPPESVAGQN